MYRLLHIKLNLSSLLSSPYLCQLDLSQRVFSVFLLPLRDGILEALTSTLEGCSSLLNFLMAVVTSRLPTFYFFLVSRFDFIYPLFMDIKHGHNTGINSFKDFILQTLPQFCQ